MRKIGFIGSYDKIDCIIYVAKILTELGKKVLVVDATHKQKARYIVPTISSGKSYVTEFEKIDIYRQIRINLDRITEYVNNKLKIIKE